MPSLASVGSHSRSQATYEDEQFDIQERAFRSERRIVTREIEGILKSAVRDQSSAITERDSREFVQMGISETALEAGGALTEGEKLRFVKEMKDHALNFVIEARQQGDAFLRKIAAAASKGWITEGSARRWKERLKEHSGSWPETQEFLKAFDDEYIENWKELHEDQQEITKLKTALKVDSTELKELAALEKKGFADEHYLDKRNIVSTALAALKTHAKNSAEGTKLHQDALAILNAAAEEKIISKKKIGPWLDHVVSGKRTIDDLKAFVIDWRRIRIQYDGIEDEIESHGREPQGFVRKSPEEFLVMSYEDRVRYVQDAKWRLANEKDIGPDTKMKDLKGKIRHAMDQQDWEEAEYYLSKAWRAAEPEDVAELHSIEQHLAKYQVKPSESEERENKKISEVRKAYEEIETALGLLPPPLQKLYIKALGKGAETTRCVTNTVYNRTWCQDRGYLTEAFESHLREGAREETEDRIGVSGEGHGDGYENNLVDGYNQPAVRGKGVGPQNIFLSSDGMDAFVEKAHTNRNVWSFWYWTNLIVDDVSASQNNYVSRNLNRIFKRNARTLERHGLFYSPGGIPLGVN